LKIEPRFSPGGFTLFPEERRSHAVRRERKQAGAQPWSYYGVPRRVVVGVLEQSQSLDVTQGELARFFFEQALAAYRKGVLEIRPVPTRQIATLFPEDRAAN
jgi:hypothetical protein